MGLAGGTGSGLGSRIIEELREYYPYANLSSYIVFPLAKGETPLQHYNIGMTLANLNQNCDFILYNSNQWLFEFINKHVAVDFEFEKVNQLISIPLTEMNLLKK